MCPQQSRIIAKCIEQKEYRLTNNKYYEILSKIDGKYSIKNDIKKMSKYSVNLFTNELMLKNEQIPAYIEVGTIVNIFDDKTSTIVKMVLSEIQRTGNNIKCTFLQEGNRYVYNNIIEGFISYSKFVKISQPLSSIKPKIKQLGLSIYSKERRDIRFVILAFRGKDKYILRVGGESIVKSYSEIKDYVLL